MSFAIRYSDGDQLWKHSMDFLWILAAFGLGFVVKQVGLPPLVGYLLAGFGLHAWGVEADSTLTVLADLGITLMLFTIGLKLNVASLLKPEVCITAISHTGLWCALLLGKWFLLVGLGLSLTSFLDMSWQTALLIAFALSFSSTVGVLKLLEDMDEVKTRHGKVAIGILVIQDIIAVIFLVFATGKLPSAWALLLLLLIPLKPAFNALLEKGGHGELLPLAGFFLALGGAELFTLVNLKGDLGALLMGVLIASYPKATELYKSMMGFKDIFLIGFFLSIGFIAVPTWDMFFAAVAISVLLPIKFVMFLLLFMALHMRPRNAFLCAMTLANFSEFGLIVANMALSKSWLSNDWVVILALAVTLSLIVSSAIFKYSHRIYTRYQETFKRLQWRESNRPFVLEQPENAKVMIVGLGRVGRATYDYLAKANPDELLGVDADEERVAASREQGRTMILGDGEDVDFWSYVNLESISLIMLSTPGVLEKHYMIEQIRNRQFTGKIVCVARYDDEREQLLAAGADAVFSYYAEVGAGFAEEGKRLVSW